MRPSACRQSATSLTSQPSGCLAAAMAAPDQNHAAERRACRRGQGRCWRRADMTLLPLAFALALPASWLDCAELFPCVATGMISPARAQTVERRSLQEALGSGLDALARPPVTVTSRPDGARAPGAAPSSPSSKSADEEEAVSTDKSRHSCRDMDGSRFDWSASNVPFTSRCDARRDIK
jgi:hypothetical protein